MIFFRNGTKLLQKLLSTSAVDQIAQTKGEFLDNLQIDTQETVYRVFKFPRTLKPNLI